MAEKLPLHPLLFILLYLASFSVIFVPYAFGYKANIYWLEAASSIALMVQVWWSYHVASYAAGFIGNRKLSGTRTIIIGLIVFLLIVVLFMASLKFLKYIDPRGALQSLFDTGSPLAGLLAFIPLLSILWISAAVLCEAEEGRRMPVHSVVGTFFLLFYLIIGAPFIYGRLKRLRV